MIRFGIPITKTQKLDDGRLLVEGVFSSDTLDKTRDVVTIDATKIAFDRWEAKNLREQHDPKKAVGKALEAEYYNEDGVAKALLRGFITPGAPDTIQKVEDKVLSYFSIGAIVNSTESFKAADGKNARRITDYDLVEISLVDNPANPDAKLKYAMAPADVETPAEPVAEPEPVTGFGRALKAAVAAAPVAVPETPTEPEPMTAAAAAPVVTEAQPAAPVTVTKHGEEWDIATALEILLGLKSLLFCETVEPETEPPAQRRFLELAIENVQAFIESEAGELAATPGAAAAATEPVEEAAEMARKPSLLKVLAAAFAARDKATADRLAAIEAKLASAPVPFTAPEGEELGRAMGELLVFTKTMKPTTAETDKAAEKTDQIAKTLGEFKDTVSVELRAMRGDLEVIKAMPVPGGPLVRRVPGVQTRSSAPVPDQDPEIQVLEKRLSNTSDPGERAVFERALRFARAKKGLLP